MYFNSRYSDWSIANFTGYKVLLNSENTGLWILVHHTQFVTFPLPTTSSVREKQNLNGGGAYRQKNLRGSLFHSRFYTKQQSLELLMACMEFSEPFLYPLPLTSLVSYGRTV